MKDKTLRGCSLSKKRNPRNVSNTCIYRNGKWAKNATFMLKPDVLCLGEGQVSSIQMLFLRLGEPEARRLINASFTSAKQAASPRRSMLLCLGEPEAS